MRLSIIGASPQLLEVYSNRSHSPFLKNPMMTSLLMLMSLSCSEPRPSCKWEGAWLAYWEKNYTLSISVHFEMLVLNIVRSHRTMYKVVRVSNPYGYCTLGLG